MLITVIFFDKRRYRVASRIDKTIVGHYRATKQMMRTKRKLEVVGTRCAFPRIIIVTRARAGLIVMQLCKRE